MTKKNETRKKITLVINSTYKYIQLWNGIFNLTEKGMQILSAFIDVQDITNEDNFCSVKNKKEVARIVGLKDYNTLNNYVKRFKDKGVLKNNNSTYTLNPFLNPNTSFVEVIINKK
jgi:predicted transcriptional regulator|tara:strand:- start:1338 stop:1685 length:348 start_codon:yes stop_codon:yes gene_type:complete